MNLIFALTSEGTDAVEVVERQGFGPAAPFLAPGALGGTADGAVERVLEYVRAGADEVNIALRAPWDEAMLDAYLELLPTIRAGADSAHN